MLFSDGRAGSLQDSFGSASWLVQREGGNVMMDSPRFDAKLLARIKVPPGTGPRSHVLACVCNTFAQWLVLVWMPAAGFLICGLCLLPCIAVQGGCKEQTAFCIP